MDPKNEIVASLDKPSKGNCSKEPSITNNEELIKRDSSQDEMFRKILHTISNGFSKGVGRKMTRLLLFIRNFGSHLITLNENGNVVIRNKVISKTSNLLDLLEACVRGPSNPKLPGYLTFVKALSEINVPKHFLIDGSVSAFDTSKSKCDSYRRKPKIKNWTPY